MYFQCIFRSNNYNCFQKIQNMCMLLISNLEEVWNLGPTTQCPLQAGIGNTASSLKLCVVWELLVGIVKGRRLTSLMEIASCQHREVQPLYLLGQGQGWPQGSCGCCVLCEVCIGGPAWATPPMGKCVLPDLDTQVAMQRTLYFRCPQQDLQTKLTRN